MRPARPGSRGHTSAMDPNAVHRLPREVGSKTFSLRCPGNSGEETANRSAPISGRLSPERLLAHARQSLTTATHARRWSCSGAYHRRKARRPDYRCGCSAPCVERARQLNGKGFAKEAAAMGTRAAQHRAAITVETLAEEDLIRFLRCLEGGEALQVYAEHLARRPPLPAPSGRWPTVW